MLEILSITVSGYLVIAGLSFVVQPEMWAKLTRDIDQFPEKYLALMAIYLIIGLAILAAHNEWSLKPTVVITILAWVIVIEAAILLIYPAALTKPAVKLIETSTMPLRVSGVLLILFGGWLASGLIMAM